MTAKDITKALTAYYSHARYVVPNIYFFGHGYCETDLLVVTDNNGWVYDVEVKISRADFKADFKKTQKHQILSTATRTATYDTKVLGGEDGQQVLFAPAGTPIACNDRPNRFYFAVPDKLIGPDEVPEYAGLLYVTEHGSVTKVKEAKVLHKKVIEVEAKLCRKFYYAYKDLAFFKEDNGVNKLRNTITRLERENDENDKRVTGMSNRNFLIESLLNDFVKELPVKYTMPITPVYVDRVPRSDNMQPANLYISKKQKRAAHLCFCGCGEYETIQLDAGGYSLNEYNGEVSVSPMLQTYGQCRSKYLINKNNVKIFDYDRKRQPNTGGPT